MLADNPATAKVRLPAEKRAGTCIHIAEPKVHALFLINLEILVKYTGNLETNGYSEATIKPRIRTLKAIAKTCNIKEPEEVKTTLAKIKWKNTTKRNFVKTYKHFAKYLGIKWEAPIYKKEERTPYIPTEKSIDELINNSGRKTATALQMLKDTGIRIGELTLLRWKDLNLERKTINITPEKGSNPRIVPISDKLISMLNTFNRTKENIFNKDKDGIRTQFTIQRKRIVELTGNQELKKISFHTLRHWKGTTEYHKTKDIMHVKYILGHKSITSTMIYINLEQATFLADTDDWICKTAYNIKEACQLIEAGFQYITEMEGIKIFKKRK